MNYCINCRRLTAQSLCPWCHAENLKEVQAADYCLLTEKEEMWAKMFEQVLTDHSVSFTALPVFGAALALRGGAVERRKIYVPYSQWDHAVELLKETFPEDP